MANIKRSSIVGFHNIKNKVSRNAFDLSHRHMFTANIGELLPIFVQWVNPNETFKLGYNGMTRTQPLQTAAFTRLRENVQYFFVPFQSLWKFFEQQVTNMTSGQSGENISRIAKSASEDSSVSTGMPYLNLQTLQIALQQLMSSTEDAVIACVQNSSLTTLKERIKYLESVGVMDNGTFRYSATIKLLRALGYLNSELDTYDMLSSYIAASNENPNITAAQFRDGEYGWYANAFNYFDVQNVPNLSIFPLLAYQKIVNDHYIYRQWQPYKSYCCNIDYLLPSDSMNFAAKLGNKPFDYELFRLRYSNLPLDYFNGVLPKAQYGEESAATVDVSGLTATATTSNATFAQTASSILKPRSTSAASNGGLHSVNGYLDLGSDAATSNPVRVENQHTHSVNLSSSSIDAALKISSLRSAIALQKYKEIQESNDSDFASQVLAHFGVKPKHDDYKSYFIGGGDATIDINPQINQNLVDDNDPTIKANGTGTLSCGCKFTSDTYGIIIGIYRCVPQLDLAHVGIDRNLFKTDAADFPIPELDSIGMQSVYRCELACLPIGTKHKASTFQNMGSYDFAKTYGYLPRYAELKTSYDRYEGAFLDSLKSWVTGYDDDALQDWLSKTISGSFDLVYPQISALLQCRPSICDNLFVNQQANCCNDDKLLVGSVNTCVAIRPLSVYGLPYSK